jgi:DNA-binding MarR family transcriptional regulator
MAEPAGANLLFLREEDIRLAQDLLMLVHRDLATLTDAVLSAHGLGRAHHRVLHFIARNPGLTVGDLLTLLGISKQSLSRVLGPLLRQGMVQQTPSRVDKRQRLLTLTQAGAELERKVFEAQRERLGRAYRLAGGPAVEGFRRVMRLTLDDKARAYVDRKEKG